MDPNARRPPRKPRPNPSEVPLSLRYDRPPGVTPLAFVLAHLKNVAAYGGGQYGARCPAHADSRNSLSVAEGAAGKVLLFCHAGCDFEDIVHALKVAPESVFPDRDEPTRTYPSQPGPPERRTYRG